MSTGGVMSTNKLVSALSVILLLAATFTTAQIGEAAHPSARISGALGAESLDGKLKIHLTFTSADFAHGIVRLDSELPDGTIISIFARDVSGARGLNPSQIGYRHVTRTITDVLGNTATDTGNLQVTFLAALCCSQPVVITDVRYFGIGFGADAATGGPAGSTDYTTLFVRSHFALIGKGKPGKGKP